MLAIAMLSIYSLTASLLFALWLLCYFIISSFFLSAELAIDTNLLNLLPVDSFLPFGFLSDGAAGKSSRFLGRPGLPMARP